MPVVVECSCSSNTANCHLSTLTLELDIAEVLSGTTAIGANHDLTIIADAGNPSAPTITLDVSTGHHLIDLPIDDWGPLWNTITVKLETESSLTQIPSPSYSAYDLFRASYRIVQEYTCRNVDTMEDTGWNIVSYSISPGPSTKCEPSDGDLRVLCYAGKSVNSVFYKSSTLATCQGCTITDTSFQPGINSTATVDTKNSGPICICATGGSGNYQYSIVDGKLPCGMTLNTDTGCIEGAPDKTCAGSNTITFRVTDLGGAGAPVGTSVTIGGTGYLDEPTFIWSSGAAFFAEMVGTSITVDGVSRTIASVDSVYQLTLT